MENKSQKDCIFCRIVKKEIPAKTVYEDEQLIAFYDINPQAPVHILIIPKKHIPTVLDADKEDANLLGSMILLANQLAKNEKIDQSGFRLVLNCNRAAGQAVFHIHLHLLGGREMGWPPG